MGFLGLQKPFQKETISKYEGVLVPLEQAQRHSTVEADYARRRSAEGAADTDSGRKHAEGKEGTSAEEGRHTGVWNPYTIEGLRAEVNEDVVASGHNSAYDRKSIPWLVGSGRIGANGGEKSKIESHQ